MRKGYILFVILIIASLLRIANITTSPPGLYPDEAMNGNNALEALATGDFKFFYPENGGREGLFINIQAIFVNFLGNEPWALRLASTFFGILTVLGVYFLAKELFDGNKKIALLAAFLIATSFWHINFSRIGFRAIMAPFFMTWSSYYLLLALRKIKESPHTSYFILLASIGGLLFGLGFHSYIAYRAMPLVFLALIPFFFKEKKFYIAGATFLVFTAIAVAPLAMHFIETPADFFGRTSQISVTESASPIKDLAMNTLQTLGMFNFRGDFNSRHNISGRPQLFWPVGIMFIVGVLIAIKTLFNALRREHGENALAYTFLTFWFGVAMLPVIISNEGLPHALRAILMIPPVIILSAAGGMSLYSYARDKIKNVKVINAAVALLACVLIFEAYNSYFNVWAKSENTKSAFNQNYVDIAREINNLPIETPKIVVVNAQGFMVRGIPTPSQTVMFLTDSFTERGQKERNITYFLPESFNENDVEDSAAIFYIN